MILAPLLRRKKPASDASVDEKSNAPAVVGFRTAYLFDVSQTDGVELLEFSSITATQANDWLNSTRLLPRMVSSCDTRSR